MRIHRSIVAASWAFPYDHQQPVVAEVLVELFPPPYLPFAESDDRSRLRPDDLFAYRPQKSLLESSWPALLPPSIRSSCLAPD